MTNNFPVLTTRIIGICLIIFISMIWEASAENKSVVIESFTDEDVYDGFRKTVFGSEYNNRNRAFKIHLKKFKRPIRLYLDINIPMNAEWFSKKMGLLIKLLPNLNIKLVENRKDANAFLHLYPNDKHKVRNYLKSFKKKTRLSKRGKKNVEHNRCSFKIFVNKKYQIYESHAFVFSDRYWQYFWGCLTEELFQSFGVVNDDKTLKYSQFNDNNDFVDIRLFDVYLLNMLYHPNIKSGIRERAVGNLLPDVLSDVKSVVTPIVEKLNE